MHKSTQSHLVFLSLGPSQYRCTGVFLLVQTPRVRRPHVGNAGLTLSPLTSLVKCPLPRQGQHRASTERFCIFVTLLRLSTGLVVQTAREKSSPCSLSPSLPPLDLLLHPPCSTHPEARDGHHLGEDLLIKRGHSCTRHPGTPHVLNLACLLAWVPSSEVQLWHLQQTVAFPKQEQENQPCRHTPA